MQIAFQPQMPFQSVISRLRILNFPIFGGNIREYAMFRSDFKHIVHSKYSKRHAITYLLAVMHYVIQLSACVVELSMPEIQTSVSS